MHVLPGTLRRITRLRDKLDGLRRRTLIGIISGIFMFLILVAHLNGVRISRTPSRTWEDDEAGGLYGPRNRTLGFEKIFYLSMPGRTDRQDMMTLIAGFMNLEFTMVDAVNGTSIIDKAKPYDVNHPPKNTVRPAELGCWRSHANIWAQIVREGLTSALILEDDADFTTGIRDVMFDINTHLHHLAGTTSSGEPYGLSKPDSWDVLTLGHCYGGGEEGPPSAKFPKASRVFEAWEDPYAPSQGHYRLYLPSSWSNRIRVLLPTYAPLCTTAYAVTKIGASRLLYNVGGPGGDLEMPVDMIMAERFKAGLLKGYVTLPRLFDQWKWGNGRDTDVQDPIEEGSSSSKFRGSSEDIVGSIREKIANLLGPGEGARNIWKEIEGGKRK